MSMAFIKAEKRKGAKTESWRIPCGTIIGQNKPLPILACWILHVK